MAKSGFSRVNPLAIAGIALGTLVVCLAGSTMINTYLETIRCESGIYLLGCTQLTYFGIGIYSAVIIFGLFLDAWSIKKFFM